jgi:hypothetical protein
MRRGGSVNCIGPLPSLLALFNVADAVMVLVLMLLLLLLLVVVGDDGW